MRRSLYIYKYGLYSNSMRILIIGATGFIGKNLVLKLQHRSNTNIFAIVRKTSKQKDILFLKKHNVNLIEADITNRKSLQEITQQFDVIVNCSGLLGDFRRTLKQLKHVNVEGVKNLVAVFKTSWFIHISSAGVLGPIIGGTEDSPYKPSNDYEQSKMLAEQVVKQHSNYVIIRPEFVYGPYDYHVLKLFKSIQNNKFRIIGSGTSFLHPTFVEDVTDFVSSLLDSSVKNEIFLIAGEKAVSVKQFYSIIAKELNVKTNRILIPKFLALGIAQISEFIANLVLVKPFITKSQVKFFTESRKINCSKAKQQLHYNPQKIEIGINKTIQWYKKNGLLK